MTTVIRIYQLLISPILLGLGCQCRFHPSCSEYARQAFQHRTFWQATRLTLHRVWRCRPGCCGGIDPLPIK